MGVLKFLGIVQRVSTAGVAVRMPGGQTLTMAVIPSPTRLAHTDHALTSEGQTITVRAAIEA